jgi:predicted DNA-binding transcriptional regulator AlpA
VNKDKLLSYDDLVDLNIVSNRMTLRRWMRDQGFPQPIQLGPNTVRWSQSKVWGWIESRQREGKE